MTTDHYFSSDPATVQRERQIEFDIDGHAVRLTAAGGVFSAARIDPGTALLLRKAPLPASDTTGALLDLGCGYGPIAVCLALAAPEATVYAVDVNRRALDLVRRNAEANGVTNIIAAEPDEVPADLRFGQVWSNPPIRIGKDALHELLARWLPRADAGWLVVARNLGADSLQQWLTTQGWPAVRHASAKGYRILSVDGGNSGDRTLPRQHNP